ncbi:hypothetical protein O9K51_10305 [Purpureocillium lavendulum]|uniref:Uncharacterized protein n=1 Tax=Purpureocillium lavendulum TaxID=1247861 RepID=A0AB34FC67_9HYPO|nr:hypothetical protein O9K51_10305 [Purpureocillium lavendulum]
MHPGFVGFHKPVDVVDFSPLSTRAVELQMQREHQYNNVRVCRAGLRLLEARYTSNLDISTGKYEERTEAVIQKLCD